MRLAVVLFVVALLISSVRGVLGAELGAKDLSDDVPRGLVSLRLRGNGGGAYHHVQGQGHGEQDSSRVCLSRHVRGVKYGPNGLDFYLRQPDVASNGGCCQRCAAQRGDDGMPACLGWLFAEHLQNPDRPPCSLLFKRYPASVFAARDALKRGPGAATHGHLLGSYSSACSCPADGGRSLTAGLLNAARLGT